ncbi:MAG: T9SS type A sorting domain-containing protein [candidate division Zixibacteria bacterium]|nr:T9SS type A sorting domain-containing protein [candidate division Zixibacteria bacterium]
MNNMKMKIVLFYLIILIFLSINANGREFDSPKGTLSEYKSLELPTRINDVQTYIDANNILMFVTNVGSVADDRSLMFGRRDGFYYPYNGNINDINTTPSVLYSAGIMIGGKVDGEIRVAVGAFESEYWPGPTDATGGKLPDDPSYKVYKIDASSGPGDPDYDNWPKALGAPVDDMNKPLLLGDQTFWSVYNDGGTHTYSLYGGATDSLGVEIHQTVWASDVPGEADAVYVKYLFFNRSVNVIEDFYVSFWVDPDLGGASDDFVGCDTTYDMFFCYNATNNDAVYSSNPPAWGGKVISSPVVPSPGDVADFDSKPLVDFKNIGMTSFSIFINGTDPDNPEEMYGYMMGNDSKSASGGDPNTPPYDDLGTQTKYYYAGDPITGTGWLDSRPADRRLMANFGPVTFNPGDVQQLVLKLGASIGSDRLTSLLKLKNMLDSESPEDPPEYVACSSFETRITNYGKLSDVYFEPNDQCWLQPVNWGGTYYGNSVDFGINFWGGFLDPESNTEPFSNVELRFTDNPDVSGQRAYNYLRGGTPSYGYQGYYLCPFQAWDIDDDRQLNVCFVEDIASDVYDQTWMPDTTSIGGREYLMIMASDYDGDNMSDAGTGAIDYTTEDFLFGSTFDFMYCGWFYNDETNSIADGQKLVFELQKINENGLVDSIQFQETAVGESDHQNVEFNCTTTGHSLFEITCSDPSVFTAEPSLIDMYNGFPSTKGKIYFSPETPGDYTETLYITDMTSGFIVDEITLLGTASDQSTALPLDNNNSLPNSFELHANYPNPFNPTTRIDFSLPIRSDVTLKIFNIRGRLVSVLVDKKLEAGVHSFDWDSKDAASGIYFYRLQADDYSATKKMLLLK